MAVERTVVDVSTWQRKAAKEKAKGHPDAGSSCVPESVWSSLTAESFAAKEVIDSLADNGYALADSPGRSNSKDPAWSPDRNTADLLKSRGGNERIEDKSCEDVYLWTGKFHDSCTGAALPAVRTRGIVPMPARSLAELLMDSARVKVSLSLPKNLALALCIFDNSCRACVVWTMC